MKNKKIKVNDTTFADLYWGCHDGDTKGGNGGVFFLPNGILYNEVTCGKFIATSIVVMKKSLGSMFHK